MHPAYSVIIFTTASGAGYGLLYWLSLAGLIGALPAEGWFAFVAIALALVLITTGLLASTLHLGHPERAIGAFSEWRTSWLSREGVAAVATYIPAGLLALFWLIGVDSFLQSVLCALSAVGALVTVWCTGMIYASLRTIRQWHQPWVPWIYVLLAGATGAVLYTGLKAIFGHPVGLAPLLSIAALAVATLAKRYYWQRIDNESGKYTAEMATGLGRFGEVRVLESPHARPNFVMREMGYSVGRKHAEKLRRLVVIALFAVPTVCLLLGLATGAQAIFGSLAVVAAAIGVFIERWLFFAEAEHVAMLYYGVSRA